MTNELKLFCDCILSPGQVVEIRCIGENATSSGYFDNFDTLVERVELLDTLPEIQGIYFTLNEVNPALLARRANRVKMRLGNKETTTADSDIIKRRFLPIDIDPVRPSGVSSSAEEHDSALARASSIAGFLRNMGWPEPVLGDSGNGAHLLYRIDLPNDEESSLLVKSCLETLHIWFSDDRCHVDTANYNAARIWKVYGTISRKGDNTAERPHRRARILSAPDSPAIIPVEKIRALATLFPKEPEKKNTTQKTRGTREEKREDLADWFDRYGIGYTEKEYHGGRLFVLDECPFSGEHKDGAYAIQFSSGGIFAGCHHTSCGSGTQRWHELREMYEERGEGRREGRDDRPKRPGESQKARQRMARREILEEAKSAPVKEYSDEAARILREADPLRFMLDTFSLDHEGDRTVAECLILSLASRSVINSKGLHVSITGESGKGKSHTIDTMLEQVPEELRLDGRLSDKALFYMTDLYAGSVIALDDVSLSDQMQEILKGVTTSFQKEFLYRTVSKDRTSQVCVIPPRCIWWVAKVEGVGDDQVFNRMLTCWIDDSEEQDMRVLGRILGDAAAVPTTVLQSRREVLIAREIWKAMRSVYVIIPYSRQIRFQNAENRRNPDMLLDLIRSYAALRQYQRKSSVENGMIFVQADEKDFSDAARLYELLNGITGGQVTKLTKREAELIAAIRAIDQGEVTIPQMQRQTKWAASRISKLLNGYMSRGQCYSGLLEKCPAISFLDRTVAEGDEGLMVHRRMKVYTWDPLLYDSWSQGGAVWLDEDHHDQDPGDGYEGEGDSGGHGSHDSHGSQGNNRDYEDDCVDDDCRKFSAEGGLFSAGAETYSAKNLGSIEDLSNNYRDSILFSAEGDHAAPTFSVRVDDDNTAGRKIAESAENDPGNRRITCKFEKYQRKDMRISAESVQKVRGAAENEGECHHCAVAMGGLAERTTDTEKNRIRSSPREDDTRTGKKGDRALIREEPGDREYRGEYTGAGIPPDGKHDIRVQADSDHRKQTRIAGNVDPDAYVRIDGFDTRHCSVCGRQGVRYKERIVKKGRKKRRGNSLLCSGCYERARMKKSRSVIALPEVVDSSQMKPAESSMGKCQVCNIREAHWVRPGIDHLLLCDLCYQRAGGRVCDHRLVS